MDCDKNFLLLLKSAGFGHGEPDLSDRLLDSFLKMLLEYKKTPGRIVCLNSGIFLTTTDSEISQSLKAFEERGSEILSCTTCLEYYGRMDKLLVGKSTTMREISKVMLESEKIIAP
jgi:selenium metabolism protein YedF